MMTDTKTRPLFCVELVYRDEHVGNDGQEAKKDAEADGDIEADECDGWVEEEHPHRADEGYDGKLSQLF